MRYANMPKLINWLFLAGFLFVLFVILLPRKGFDLTDHGYYLYNAWLISQGSIPTVGYAGVINAIFMFFGFHKYLLFEIVYFAFQALCITVFWSSFQSLKDAYLLPLTIVAILSLNTTYILSYHLAPANFLLLAFGFLFHAIKANNSSLKRLMLVACAIAFNFACFSNISLMPILLLNWLIVAALLRREEGQVFFHLPYIIIGIILLIFYLQSPLSVFHSVAAKDQVLADMPHKANILLHILFLDHWWLFSIACFLPLLRILPISKRINENQFSIAFTCALIALFVFYSAGIFQHFINGLRSPVFFNIRVLKLFLFKLSFFYFSFCSVLFFLKKGNNRVRLMAVFLSAAACATLLSLATMEGIIDHFIMLTPVFFAIMGVTFCTPPISRTFCIFSFIFFMLLALIGAVCFLSYTYRSFSVFGKKQPITSGFFSGLYVNHEKLEVIQAIQDYYQKQDCDSKFIFAYPELPLLYYLFLKQAPNKQQWAAPINHSIYEKSLIAQLKAEGQWCVFYAPNFVSISTEYLQGLTQYLDKHSAIKLTFNSNSKTKRNDYFPKRVVLYAN